MQERDEPVIQLCRSTGLAGRPALLDALRRAGATVELVPCLDQCTLCHRRSVALVRGWPVYGRTPQELCDRVLAMMQEQSRRDRQVGRPSASRGR